MIEIKHITGAGVLEGLSATPVPVSTLLISDSTPDFRISDGQKTTMMIVTLVVEDAHVIGNI